MQVISPETPAAAGGKPVFPPDRRLPVGRPAIGAEEIAAVSACLESGWIGCGQRCDDFERAFAAYKGAPAAVSLNSCTAALHLSLLGLGIGPGDDVIVPSMTFCATAASVLYTGARPVLADCHPTELVVTAAEIERVLTPRTRAIIVVHMCGRVCDMDPILELARRHGLRVVEDCAHAVEATDQGRAAGLLGDTGCFSFYATKSIATGDGGAVISNDVEFLARIRRLSRHGLSHDAYARMRTPSHAGYEVEELGFKYNMTDIQAALGEVQLRHVETRWARRAEVWAVYRDQLRDAPVDLPPPCRAGSRHAYHLFTPLLRLEQLRVGRPEIMAALRAEGVGTGLHYLPVHVHPFYRRLTGLAPEDLPNAWRAGERTLSLPLYSSMTVTEAEQAAFAFRRVLSYYAK